PMAIAAVEPNCDVWFFTGRSSLKVHEIQDDQSVLVACQDEHQRYISLLGRAELVAERPKTRQLWNDSYKMWFPQGLGDPDLLLICIHASEAEYWDNRGVKGVRYLFQTAGTRARATRPASQEGEQRGKVNR
ncbi:MAG TPA: pyridoxamine 5'-phosphate oxidase family protein, partial [Candidatus Limnocylindria bacterium]|nr:pyridoxamine 5'-phosphate oxidase family protein [Candidatus Limnocylindria bacterium]